MAMRRARPIADKVLRKIDRYQRNKLVDLKAFIGVELVPGMRRLALMNCLLHGMQILNLEGVPPWYCLIMCCLRQAGESKAC